MRTKLLQSFIICWSFTAKLDLTEIGSHITRQRKWFWHVRFSYFLGAALYQIVYFFFENFHRSRSRWKNQVFVDCYWLWVCRTELDHSFVSSDDVWRLAGWRKRKCRILKLTAQLVRPNVVRWCKASSPGHRIHLFRLRKKIFWALFVNQNPESNFGKRKQPKLRV